MANRSAMASGGGRVTVLQISKGHLWHMELSCILFVVLATEIPAGVKTQ